MKILVITNNINPNSGWGRYSKEIIDEYAKRNLTYEVLTTDTLSIQTFFLMLIKARMMAKTVDIVHAFDGWPYAIYGLAATIGTKKKLFINAVGTYSVAPLQNFFKGKLLALAYKKANGVFPISNFVKNKILEYVKLLNIETIYLGTTLLPRPTQEDIYSFRKEFDLVEDKRPILLTVGAIKERKGQFDTVQAVLLLKKDYPNILYLIVGSDKDVYYVNKINAFISLHSLDSNIKIITNVKSDKQLSCLYSFTDVFILSSKQDGRHFEGFGLVMLEAAQFGIPVVGSEGGGIPEAMKDGYNGYLSNEGDPNDIKNSIMRVLNNHPSLSENSKQFFKKFSWQKTVDFYLKNYLK